MEHFRSTIATASAAVLGLVAAAHILHPGNFEAQPRAARPAVAVVAPAWIDPPRQIQNAAAARTPDMEAILAPRMMSALPPDAVSVAPLPSEISPQPTKTRKAERAQRRKVAQRGARIRQASLQAAPDRGTSAAPALPPSPAPAKSDPLGDLIRGLGLGRDS